ncbi:MAG: YihY/virulence factor BrkB family protein [Acidobacteriota bacterium]
MSFLDNNLTTSAAAISYSLILALFPSLLFLLTIGNSLIGPERVERYVLKQVLDFFPVAYGFIRNNLESLSSLSTRLIITCFIGMLWAGMGIFSVIETALNRIYGTSPRSFLHGRAVNFAMINLVFALLGVSALSTAVLTGLQSTVGSLPIKLGEKVAAFSGFVWQSLFVLVSMVITITLFTVMYKWLPNTKISTREALTGGIIAGVLWECAKYGFSFLLPFFNYDLLHGSIGAAVALLTWVYTSSVIMLFGVQFTAILHRDHLLHAVDAKAVPVVNETPIGVSE